MTIADETALPPVGCRPAGSLFEITCETGANDSTGTDCPPRCPVTFQGSGSYASAWAAAVDAGWKTDLAGVRHCPACVDERQPVVTLWLGGDALTAYIARQVPPTDLLDAPSTRIVLVAEAVPVPAADAADRAQADADASLARWSRPPAAEAETDFLPPVLPEAGEGE